MRFCIKFILIVNLLLFAESIAAQKTVTANNSSINLQNHEDSLQYVLGSFLGLWVRNNGFAVTNPNLFIKAMDNVFQNKTRMIPDSIIPSLVDFYQRSTQKERAIKQEQQLFASLKDKSGIGMFPNGVRYTIVKAGKGPRPFEKDSISVHLTAKLPDGTVVEDTYKANKPFAATPTSFFPGLNETLLEMSEGAKWTIYVPSVLAYGDKGTAQIPPNSALILDVELLEIKIQKK